MKKKELDNELISIHIALDELNDDMADWKNMNIELQRQLTEIEAMFQEKNCPPAKKEQMHLKTDNQSSQLKDD